jgi:hypothetical protein
MGGLFPRPIFSIRHAALELRIPFRTAESCVDKLVNAGILREITGYARNRIFQANEILNAIQESCLTG